MRSSTSNLTNIRLIPCLKSDCNVTFHDTDLCYLHFVRSHHPADKPKPIVNELIAASLRKFLEDKKKYFREPPRKMEPEEEIILACHDSTCEQTFTCVLLRDFHYNRMHHSRHPSILSYFTKTEDDEKQRRHRYECIKSDCGGRFLSVELRDFHCSRVHPMLWKRTQVMNDILAMNEDNNEARQILGADMTMSMATKLEFGTPFTEKSEIAFISGPELFATSVFGSDDSHEDKIVDNLSLSTVKSIGLEFVFAKQVNTLVIKVDMVESSLANSAVECKSAAIKAMEKHMFSSRPIFGYRSRSEAMMNRNALANPGASKWVVRL